MSGTRAWRQSAASDATELSGPVGRQAVVVVENSGRTVTVLAQMELERVAVLGRVDAVGTAVLVDVDVRLGVAVQHGPVDARVAAPRAAERLGTDVVAHVVLEMVLELGHKRALRTRQHSLRSDVNATVDPELLLQRERSTASRFCQF